MNRPSASTGRTVVIGVITVAVLTLLAFFAIVRINRGSELAVAVPAGPAPAAVANSPSPAAIVETTALPLAITTIFLPALAKLAVGGGAIDAVGQQIVVMDGDGHLLSYDGRKVRDSAIPDLPMHLTDFAAHPESDTVHVALRAHGLRFHDGFLFASYDAYDRVSNRIHFEIAKISLRPDSAIPNGAWQVIFKGDEISVSDYRLGRGTGGQLAFSGGVLYFAIGDYNLNYSNTANGLIPAAQERASTLGKVFGYDLKTGKFREISFGHRVPGGLVITSKGELLETENAERGGDKLNRISNDGNYGWPFDAWGTHYFTYDNLSGGRELLHELAQFVKTELAVPAWNIVTARSLDLGRVVDPVYAWLPSISPSAIVEIRDFHPAWNGDLLVGSLKAQSLFRLRYKDGRVVYSERIWIGHRIRDMINLRGQLVLWTDDGSLVFLSVANDLLAANEINKDPAYNNLGFYGCVTCHSFADDNRYYWAPSLHGVFGRPIAASAFSGYSAGLKAKKGLWTEDNLAAFLSSPEAFAPGTTMPNEGLSAQDVLQLVAALKAEQYAQPQAADRGP